MELVDWSLFKIVAFKGSAGDSDVCGQLHCFYHKGIIGSHVSQSVCRVV